MSLTTLASVNRRLLSIHDDESVSQTVDYNTKTEGPDPPDEDDKPDEFRGWSQTDRTEFERGVLWLRANVELPEGSTTFVDSFLEDWAIKWREEQGFSLTESIDATPRLDQLFEEPGFINGAIWLSLTATAQFPSIFTSEKTVEIEGETEVVELIGVADPLEGVQFIEIPAEKKKLFRETVRVFRDTLGLAGSLEKAAELEREGKLDIPFPGLTQVSAGGFRDPFLTGFPLSPGVYPEDFVSRLRAQQEQRRAVEDAALLPHFTQEQLAKALKDATTPPPGSSPARRVATFDRDNLIEQASTQWQGWLLEGPNLGAIDTIVDDYIREAGAFWTSEGGRLDFDTFLSNRLRTQPRYATIFRHKPEAMTEDLFLRQFRAIGDLGLRPESSLTQLEASVTSGGSPSGQLQRVTRGREFQTSGGFSQRLASVLSGLGSGARV